MNAQVLVGKADLSSFCEANGIRRLAIFGSAIRDDFGPDSDIDVLVEFEADRIPGLLGLAGIELELSRLFRGRRVDLRTLEDLSPYFRQEVLATAELQYAEG
jgi:predicted nucleotidyltransferase